MTLTPTELEQVQRMVALRMSIDGPAQARTWHEWTDLISRRLAVAQMYTHEEDRPSFSSVLLLAADVMAMLVVLDQAEVQDPMSNDQEAA